MSKDNIMQQALGEQWSELPHALQAHYQSKNNTDVGTLDIEYPVWMQLFLNILRMMGALLNRKGKSISTTVEKEMLGDVQYWNRTIKFDDGKKIYFKSHWCYLKNNKLVEFVNPFLGLCMSVNVRDKTLYYTGEYYLLKLGRVIIPIPEWMLLGHTTIVEKEVDSDRFTMDFKLHHPLLGQIYRYAGNFTTISK